MDKSFEIALIVPHISNKVALVEEFLQDMKTEHSRDVLKSINLYSWSSSDSLGIILAFDFHSFLPRYFNRIKALIPKTDARLFELMAFGETERKEFKNKFILTSDLKFIGDFDIPFALKSILIRINGTLGRKHVRYSASIKVAFKSREQFIHEYTSNISKGGIFVSTGKAFPLKSRVELLLSLPNSPEEVKVIGEVVHIINADQAKLMGYDKAPGMGIQFLEFEDNGQKILDAYFLSLSKTDSGTFQ